MNSQLLANAIRMLSVDAIQKANSGHPGAPMGMADIAEVVWRRHLRHNPKNPQWFNRDRYVQSNGHGSMLIYALLHLTGYDLSMDDIRDFRQLHSRTPGHPEYGYTPGVETTTGPLGQGVANAVGMAIAEKALAAEFNKPGFNIVDHHTWLFLGDGCLMEGISHEACGLAGTLKLGNLIAIWDDNGISIDGHVEGWFAEDTAARFRAYGWHVIEGVDGHDPEAVDAAVREAKSVTDKPSLLCCKTIIGFGSPNKANSHDCHGSALGADEVALVRERLQWPYAPFEIPGEIYAEWDATEKGAHNGGLIRDPISGETVYERTLGRELTHEILDFFRKRGWYIQIYADDKLVVLDDQRGGLAAIAEALGAQLDLGHTRVFAGELGDGASAIGGNGGNLLEEVLLQANVALGRSIGHLGALGVGNGAVQRTIKLVGNLAEHRTDVCALLFAHVLGGIGQLLGKLLNIHRYSFSSNRSCF